MDADTPNVLEQALAAMPHQELLDLVVKLATEQVEFRRTLLAHIRIPTQIIQYQPRSAQQVERLKAEIEQCFDELQVQASDHFYREDGEAEADLELNEIFETIKTLNPLDQIELFWHVVVCGNALIEEAPISTAPIEAAIGLQAEALRQLELPHWLKRPHFDTLIAALSWEVCNYGDTVEALKSALDTLGTSAEDYHYLIEQFETNQSPDAQDWIAGYYLKLGDEASYLRVRQANLHTEAQYLELAQYWQQAGEATRWLATLEAWVTSFEQRKRESDSSYFAHGWSGRVSILSILASYYRAQQQDEHWHRILMATAEHDRVSLALYQQLEALSTKLGQWPESQPQLLKWAQRDSTVLAEIYLYQQDWQAAIRLAQRQHQSESLQTLVAEAVKGQHPAAAIAIYQQLVQSYIDLKHRDHYRRAAGYAARIKSIYQAIVQDADAWQHYITQVRQAYPRHRALQEEFAQL